MTVIWIVFVCIIVLCTVFISVHLIHGLGFNRDAFGPRGEARNRRWQMMSNSEELHQVTTYWERLLKRPEERADRAAKKIGSEMPTTLLGRFVHNRRLSAIVKAEHMRNYQSLDQRLTVDRMKPPGKDPVSGQVRSRQGRGSVDRKGNTRHGIGRAGMGSRAHGFIVGNPKAKPVKKTTRKDKK
jgi:hypothetical protein